MGTHLTGRAVVGLAVAGALLLGACSSDDEPEASEAGQESDSPAVAGPSSEPTEEALVAYAEEFHEGWLAADGDGTYPALSIECQTRWELADWEENAAAMVSFAEGVANLPGDQLQVSDVTVESFEGESATIVLTWSDATGTVFEGLGSEPAEWVYENGGWRTNECQAISELLTQ